MNTIGTERASSHLGRLLRGKNVVLVGLIIFGVVSCHLAEAQQPGNIPKVGFISSTGSPDSISPLFAAFQEGLRELGYADGKNIVIVHRYAEGRLDRMAPFVQEFVQQKVDAIVAINNVVIQAAKEATKTIPIVMISSVDPIAAGYVESFARPGGNITGLAWLNRDISAKRLELLKEVLPKMVRLGVLWDADGPGPMIAVKEYGMAARAFKIDFKSISIRGPNPDLLGAFRSAKTAHVQAFVIVGNALLSKHAEQIFDLATSNRLPSMTEARHYVHAGGLMSYGANLPDMYRRAASYVAEILRGARPAELSVKLPSKFELFLNLKTAEKLGILIPQHVMLQADKIIKD